ncbi:MAG: response regulator [Nitrospirae bacterium]|nr:response regulator [Candidatus Manganitrophaceae bacterium]
MNTHGTVLIVDDERGPRESLKLLLKPLYQVEEADGGLRAMQIIKKLKVDLVTLDLRMPRMDGIAVLKSIKKYNPHIEVMIITGHGGETHGSAADLVHLGASSYHTKPFNAPQLMVEVARAIENKRNLEHAKRRSAGGAMVSGSGLRVPLISIASLTCPGMDPLSDLLVQDICSHGIGIHSQREFQTGELLRIQLTFASNRKKTITESIVGEVVWTNPLQKSSGHSTRIRFNHIGEENRKLLEYIKGFEEKD